MIISVYQNYENIVNILLENGCNIEKTDSVIYKQFGKQAIDRAKSINMIDLLKNAIAKNRKGKIQIKSPARSLRSFSPNRTPNNEKQSPLPIKENLSSGRLPKPRGPIERRRSLESKPEENKRPSTPQSFSRTFSERSLSLDYRKQIKEKVDKRTKEKIAEIQKTSYLK